MVVPNECSVRNSYVTYKRKDKEIEILSLRQCTLYLKIRDEVQRSESSPHPPKSTVNLRCHQGLCDDRRGISELKDGNLQSLSGKGGSGNKSRREIFD